MGSRPPPGHSPHTQQPIVRCPGEEVEPVAVRRARGGEAQGRDGRGVAREGLPSEQHRGANTCHTDVHGPVAGCSGTLTL